MFLFLTFNIAAMMSSANQQLFFWTNEIKFKIYVKMMPQLS